MLYLRLHGTPNDEAEIEDLIKGRELGGHVRIAKGTMVQCMEPAKVRVQEESVSTLKKMVDQSKIQSFKIIQSFITNHVMP